MKKIISLVVCLILAICLVGCERNYESKGKPTPTPVPTYTPSPTPVDEELQRLYDEGFERGREWSNRMADWLQGINW